MSSRKTGVRPETVKRIESALNVMSTKGFSYKDTKKFGLSSQSMSAIIKHSDTVKQGELFKFTGNSKKAARQIARAQYKTKKVLNERQKKRLSKLKVEKTPKAKTAKTVKSKKPMSPRTKKDGSISNTAIAGMAKKFIDMGDLQTAKKLMDQI